MVKTWVAAFWSDLFQPVEIWRGFFKNTNNKRIHWREFLLYMILGRSCHKLSREQLAQTTAAGWIGCINDLCTTRCPMRPPPSSFCPVSSAHQRLERLNVIQPLCCFMPRLGSFPPKIRETRQLLQSRSHSSYARRAVFDKHTHILSCSSYSPSWICGYLHKVSLGRFFDITKSTAQPP